MRHIDAAALLAPVVGNLAAVHVEPAARIHQDAAGGTGIAASGFVAGDIAAIQGKGTVAHLDAGTVIVAVGDPAAFTIWAIDAQGAAGHIDDRGADRTVLVCDAVPVQAEVDHHAGGDLPSISAVDRHVVREVVVARDRRETIVGIPRYVEGDAVVDMVGAHQNQPSFAAVGELNLVSIVVAGEVGVGALAVQAGGEHAGREHLDADRILVLQLAGDLDKYVGAVVVQVHVVCSTALGVAGDVDVAGDHERAALAHVHAAAVTARGVTGDLAALHVEGAAIDADTASVAVGRVTVRIAADHTVVHGEGAVSAQLHATLVAVVGDGAAIHVEGSVNRDAAAVAGDRAVVHVQDRIRILPAAHGNARTGLVAGMGDRSCRLGAVVQVQLRRRVPCLRRERNHRTVGVEGDAVPVEAEVDGRPCRNGPRARERHVLGQHVVARARRHAVIAVPSLEDNRIIAASVRMGPLGIQGRIRGDGKRSPLGVGGATAISCGVPAGEFDSIAIGEAALAGHGDRIVIPVGAAFRSRSRRAVRVEAQHDLLAHVELAGLFFLCSPLEDVVSSLAGELSSDVVLKIRFSGVGEHALLVSHGEADGGTRELSGHGNLLATGKIHVAGLLGSAPANLVPADIRVAGDAERAILQIHATADRIVRVRVAGDAAASHVEDRVAAVDVDAAGGITAVVSSNRAAAHVERAAGDIHGCLAGRIGVRYRAAAHVERAAGDINLSVALPAGLSDGAAEHVERAAADRNTR